MSKTGTHASKNGGRSNWQIFRWCKLYSKWDLREQSDRGQYKREVMFTPLDLYFQLCIVALWKSGVNISLLVQVLHAHVGWKTM